ncbi:SDH family Clp fold serine proteinase [Variovorax atrisoli]|uniref:SDH family Clp fold serine proteinase n=1 Tax=Variovorax atrisoli TaxID=3394203 RepID=UPI00403FF7BB
MKDALNEFERLDTDAYVYAGPIEKSGYDLVCDRLEENKNKRKKVILFLSTGGGNPHAGYRIARAFSHHYGSENFRIAVTAECKSAGTLICVGASSLIFFDKGELGPLDVQFQKQDEIFQQSSGLDILRGMTYLQNDALEAFNAFLMDINGGSGLSTKVASEIASSLVKGIYEPMYAQIDPIRLGEMNAALQIANDYGERLNEKAKNLKDGALKKLIHSYPAHGFVIDRAEARKLFERVDPPTPAEAEFGLPVNNFWWRRGRQNTPIAVNLIDFLTPFFPKEPPNAQGTTNDAGPQQDGGGAGAVDQQEQGGSSSGQSSQDDAGEQPSSGGQENNA